MVTGEDGDDGDVAEGDVPELCADPDCVVT